MQFGMGKEVDAAKALKLSKSRRVGGEKIFDLKAYPSKRIKVQLKGFSLLSPAWEPRLRCL